MLLWKAAADAGVVLFWEERQEQRRESAFFACLSAMTVWKRHWGVSDDFKVEGKTRFYTLGVIVISPIRTTKKSPRYSTESPAGGSANGSSTPEFGCKTTLQQLSRLAVRMGHRVRRQNLPAVLSLTCTVSNNVAPFAVYITWRRKGVELLSIAAPKCFLTFGQTPKRSLHSCRIQNYSQRRWPLPDSLPWCPQLSISSNYVALPQCDVSTATPRWNWIICSLGQCEWGLIGLIRRNKRQSFGIQQLLHSSF